MVVLSDSPLHQSCAQSLLPALLDGMTLSRSDDENDSLLTSFPLAYVFIKKWRLYLCGVLNGNEAETILVLENKILLKLRPALLIGCSYIFSKNLI